LNNNCRDIKSFELARGQVRELGLLVEELNEGRPAPSKPETKQDEQKQTTPEDSPQPVSFFLT
jgi:hypothetical protein